MWCSVTSVKISKRNVEKISCFPLDSFTLQPCNSQHNNKCECVCVFVVVCVNVSLWIPAYCLASHPVCCAVECSITAYSTCYMSLRCHNAAQFLLIFLTFHSEQPPPRSSFHSLSYCPCNIHMYYKAHTQRPFPLYRDKPGSFKEEITFSHVISCYYGCWRYSIYR